MNFTEVLNRTNDTGDVENLTMPGAHEETNHLEQLTYNIRIVVLPILCAIGFVGNSLTMLILCRRKNRASSTSVYFLFLAVFDTLTIITGNFSVWIFAMWDFRLRAINTATCKLHVFFTYLCIHMSTWILVLLTCERVLSVVRPHRVKILCTRKKSIISLMLTTLVLTSINLHFLFGMTHRYSPITAFYCHGITHNYNIFLDKIYPIIDFCVAFAIPCPIIVVGNLIIITKLSSISRQRQQMMASEYKNVSLTVTLLLLNVLFILSTGPASLYMFLFAYLLEVSQGHQIERLRFLLAMLNILTGLNASLNFFLYFLSGSKFRADARASLCCGKSERQQRPSSI